MSIFPESVLRGLKKARGHKDFRFLAAAVVCFVVFLLLVYFPLQRKYDKTTKLLAAKGGEIAKLKLSGIGFLQPQELAKLQERASLFEKGFVEIPEVAAVLDEISDQAEKNRVNVVQIHSGETYSIKDKTGAAVEWEGRKCFVAPIHITLEAGYTALGDFLRSLREDFHRLFVVEDFVITRPEKGKGDLLECRITLNFFAR